MKKMMSKHKMLACLVAAGLAVNLAGGSPVEAKKSDGPVWLNWKNS